VPSWRAAPSVPSWAARTAAGCGGRTRDGRQSIGGRRGAGARYGGAGRVRRGGRPHRSGQAARGRPPPWRGERRRKKGRGEPRPEFREETPKKGTQQSLAALHNIVVPAAGRKRILARIR